MPPISKQRRAELDALVRHESAAQPVEASRQGDRLQRKIDERDAVISIFGGAVRSGSWEPPARLSVTALFGGVELDFREADLLEGTTRIDVLALFGGVEIKVPPDVDVSTRGMGIFGGFTNHNQRARQENAPRLEIHGFALFGGCGIKRKR